MLLTAKKSIIVLNNGYQGTTVCQNYATTHQGLVMCWQSSKCHLLQHHVIASDSEERLLSSISQVVKCQQLEMVTWVHFGKLVNRPWRTTQPMLVGIFFFLQAILLINQGQ